jgi:superfamily II DNA or RNA helicase
MGPDGEEIHRQIAREEARLAEIEAQREEARKALAMLRSRLAGSLRPPSPKQLNILPPAIAPTMPLEKVRLFRRLFRGREDVFPKLWTNPRKGTKGYSPACSNEWVRGVCEKPKVKCGACPNQAFIAVEDQVILDHLQGRHVIGVYPLLEDETCWFLAADFDKTSWKDDVSAFVETCRAAGIPAAVERSRSGNGAHVWFFFAEPVPANLARNMGCFLLTETMACRHQLAMDSYDRLFPNQDTMPRGGFGNLIALPLQHGPRQNGNTVFVDGSFEPYREQWSYLAAIEPVERKELEAISAQAGRRGKVVGVRWAGSIDEEDETPWTKPPSGRMPALRLSGPLPRKVQAVLAQRLFVAKEGLPSALLDAMQRLAAFQNPEFYKKQKMRLSTAGTPRVIACAEELSHHLSLPRGCMEAVKELLEEHGVVLEVEDQRHGGDRLELDFQGTLTPVQEEAAKKVLEHDTGVFVAPPGTGKTVLGTYLISRRAQNTLVLVHRQPLLEQWAAQIAMFLGIDEEEVGRIGGGKKKPKGRLDVAMIQSLVRKGQVNDLVGGYGHVIVDECHHVPAVSFERVLSEVKARYLVGLTATPQRRDGHHPITEMQLGPIRFAVDPKSEAARRPFEERLIVRETAFRLKDGAGDPSIQEIYAALAGDDARNCMIINDVIRALEEGRSPILLTERREHLDFLAERLSGSVRHLVVLHGGMKAKERMEIGTRLASIPDGEERLVLAIGRYIGEGFDDARLDTLFLAMPISWKGTLVQYAGRLHRLHSRKKEVCIYDYVDREVPVLSRMFEKRLRSYRAIGYARGDDTKDSEEPVGETTVEWDEEALRHFDG